MAKKILTIKEAKELSKQSVKTIIEYLKKKNPNYKKSYDYIEDRLTYDIERAIIDRIFYNE